MQEAKGGFASGMSAYGNAGGSRFDEMTHFGSGYSTPGWQRAQARGKSFGGATAAFEEEEASQDYEAYDCTDIDARSGKGGATRPIIGRGQVVRRSGRAPRTSAATPPAAAARSPSKASWSPNPPAPSPPSRSATACFTRNSATATSPASTATS